MCIGAPSATAISPCLDAQLLREPPSHDLAPLVRGKCINEAPHCRYRLLPHSGCRVLGKLPSGHAPGFVEDDRRCHSFAVQLVHDREAAGVKDGLVRRQDVVDAGGIDVDAFDIDVVDQPALEMDLTVPAHRTAVAGPEPALQHHGLRTFGVG
jgi:hypothetical protein